MCDYSGLSGLTVLKQVTALTVGVAWSEQIIQMAGLVAKCGFALLSFVFIAFWSLLTLLNVVLVILRHPFQALKKTPRDGEDKHQI